MPHTRLLSICQTPDSHTEKLPLLDTLLEEGAQPRTQVQAWSQERLRVLLWCSWETGTGNLHLLIPVPPSHEQMDHLLRRMPRLMGLQTSISKMHCLLLRLSTSPCHRRYEMSLLSLNLLQEMREKNLKVVCIKPYVYCKVFEDNAGALDLTRLPKLRPRTKHINVCYHHLCKHVQKGLIKIFPINTKDQIADALTIALAQNDLQRHRHYMCGA